jgi:cyclopropane fatty-acyl-phospholipid synthase-like methyltransferase
MSKFGAKENKEYWNEYAQKLGDNPYGASDSKHFVELENHFIESILKLGEFNSMLDIGCGNGQRTMLFSKYVKQKSIGIDYSENMIKEANASLLKQDEKIKNKLSFEVMDVNSFSKDVLFDVIISCRCFINQPSTENQINLFKSLHNKLKPGGSLIIAEISAQGMNNVNELRKIHDLPPMQSRWHNLHIDEDIVFPEVNKIFEIKKIKRLGTFYYISRVIHPLLVYPDEPSRQAKINDIAVKSEIVLQDEFSKSPIEKYGGHLLVHLVKK